MGFLDRFRSTPPQPFPDTPAAPETEEEAPPRRPAPPITAEPIPLMKVGDRVLHGFRGSPAELWERWQQLQARYGETGEWPVLLAGSQLQYSEEGLVEMETFEEMSGTPEERIIEAERADLGALWARWAAENQDPDVRPGTPPPVLPPMIVSLQTAYAAAPAELLEEGHLEHPEALVCVPAPPWAVPAFFDWSGTANCDISGAEVSAVLRELDARYGAQLVVMGFDELHLWVARPPRGQEAQELARLLDGFCPDAVSQDLGSIEDLAEMLEGPVWRFWWD